MIATAVRRAAGLSPLILLALVLGGCASGGAAPRAEAKGVYSFWPLAPAEPRIQFVKAFQSSLDVTQERQSAFQDLVFGAESADAAAIEKPYGVEIRDGKIYVCDIRRPGLAVLDLRTRQMRLVGVQGVNRLAHPVDVAVADDGYIYIADNERNVIVVYNPQERYETAFGRQGLRPVSVAVHEDRLYVCDLEGQRIEIMNRRTGEKIGEFGSVGDGEGQFRVPLCVETDRQGFVYVSDMMRSRLQKFTPDGQFVAAFGQLGDVAGSFARPKQLAVDNDGIVYVVDAAFQNVQMFNDEFSLLMSFGSAGEYPGAMNLPVGISVSDEGVDLVKDLIHPGFDAYRLVVVTNQFGPFKVAMYALGMRKDGWSVAQLHANSLAEAGVGQNETLAPLQDDPGRVAPDTVEPPQGPAPSGAPEEDDGGASVG
jgi:hypothetical protein